MSERQAKQKRKNEVKEIQKKKKNPLDIIVNIVIVVLILAILGLGGWSVYNKFKSSAQENETAVTDSNQTTQTSTPTVEEYAQAEGKTADEFLAEYGLADDESVTGETPISDVVDKLTLANYAKLSGSDVAAVKESLGLSDEYADDTLMSVIFEEQAALAETQTETENPTEEVAE